MAEDKKKAVPTSSGKQTVSKKTPQPAKKTIKREDVAKIAASTAQTIKKAAKTSVHQTAVAIIKVQDATKKKQEQKKAERAAAAKDPNAKKKTTWDDIKVMGGNLLSKMAKGGAMQLRSNAEEVNKHNVFPVPDGDTGDGRSPLSQQRAHSPAPRTQTPEGQKEARQGQGPPG